MLFRRGESGLLIPSPGIQVARAPFQTYSDKVLNIENANLIGYWRFNEISGTTADNYEGTAARDGTYNNVTLDQTGIGDGLGATQIVPANENSSVDFDTASFTGAFNGDEGTVAMWTRVRAASVWSDGVFRATFVVRVDGSNEMHLAHTNNTNELRWLYIAGGVTEDLRSTAQGAETDWFHLAMTWSAAGDIVRAYYNGSEVTTGTTLGTWAGDPENRDVWGAGHITGNNSEYDGYIAHGAIWTTPLSAAQILSLATV